MKNVVALLLLSTSIAASAQKVSIDKVQNYMNSSVTVCGKIYNGVFLETVKDSPTLLNMGGIYPNQQLTLLIWGENLKDFPANPQAYFANKQACVTGMVIEYRGKPEIVLRSPDQIQIEPESPLTVINSGRTTANNSRLPASRTTVPPTKTSPATKNPVVAAPTSTKPISATTGGSSAVSTKPASPNTSAGGTRAATTGTPSNTTNPVVKSAPTQSQQVDGALDKDDIKLSTTVAMRAGPGTNYTSITDVKAGTIVTLLFSANGWSQVVIKNGKDPFSSIGYIKSSLLK